MRDTFSGSRREDLGVARPDGLRRRYTPQSGTMSSLSHVPHCHHFRVSTDTSSSPPPLLPPLRHHYRLPPPPLPSPLPSLPPPTTVIPTASPTTAICINLCRVKEGETLTHVCLLSTDSGALTRDVSRPSSVCIDSY